MEVRSQSSELFAGAVILSNGDQGYALWHEADTEGHGDNTRKLLQLDIGNGTVNGKLLLGYSDTGVPTPLPKDVPTFWVTAPTSVSTGIGVIVNADWAIDSGRANLHNSDANFNMAAKMAEGLYRTLAASWNRFQNCELTEKCSFYRGLWNVFTNLRNVNRWDGAELGVSLLRRIVWGTRDEPGGYRKFISAGHDVIPTGIGIGLCSLTSIESVVDQAVLRPEVERHFLREGVPNAVTASVFKTPNDVLGLKVDVKEWGWRAVFEKLLHDNPRLTPELVNGEFGKVFNAVLATGFSDDDNGPSQEEIRCAKVRLTEVNDVIRRFLFLSKAVGEYARADDLLAPGIVREGDRRSEQLKTDFAPAKAQLSDQYEEMGLAVFKCCRDPRGGINQETLAEYAIAVAANDKRKAVLRYLCSDDCGNTFSNKLAERINDRENWISELQRRDRFNELTDELNANQKMIVAARLGLQVEWDLVGTAEKEELIRAANSEECLYTKKWLDACLKLEEMEESGETDGGNRKGDREAVVTFKKMRPIDGQPGVYELSQTETSIPNWFSEEVNQQLSIRLDDGTTINTVIDSMSVRQYKIVARIKFNSEPDCARVISATTRATRPKFLLEALKERYEELNLPDEYNFKDNLPQDVRFVFGPPGTGKTTYIATEVLMSLVKEEPVPHILVLTPTNKAADVLVSRVIEKMKEAHDESYKNWLRRFGISLDPTLKDDDVLCGKRIDIADGDGRALVVATTMIRFAYDNVLLSDDGRNQKPLQDFKWDYVVVDEASMVSLIQILYPITKAKDSKFVIAGDPNQIAPVVRATPLIDQNIYKMVGLNRFEDHDYIHVIESNGAAKSYPVHCLATQYRSTPAIGRVFDLFCYGIWNAGSSNASVRKLTDSREVDARPITLEAVHGGGNIEVRPLTILRFPVYKVEGVYKVRKIGWSSYHVYSALFIFEFIRKIIAKVDVGTQFSIGIISPYRIQADIMMRMFDQERNSKKIPANVIVQASTVHGFQGDQCDMIIALLNPPSGMGKSQMRDGKEITSPINNTNILNVAISRAKDYLVVAMPEERSRNYERLVGPRKILDIVRAGSDGTWIEHSMHGYGQVNGLEQSLWNDADYIERNTFQTGHQNVNVYVPQTMRYEVRAEDSAIDIQFTDGEEFVKKLEEAQIETSRDREEREVKALQNRKVPDGFRRVNGTDAAVQPGMRYFLEEDDPSQLPEGRLCRDEEESRIVDMDEVWAVSI